MPTSQRPSCRRPGRTATRPAEARRPLPKALDEVARREGPSGFGIGRRLVADPQVHRIHPEGHGKLVHRALQRVHAGSLTRGPHPVRRRHVEGDEAMGGPSVRGRVQVPGPNGGLLGELAAGRCLLPHVVADRAQRAVGGGTETQPLHGWRSVAGQAEHLSTAHGQFHRPAHHPRCHCRGDRWRPDRALRAERPADVRVHQVDVGLVDPERGGDLGSRPGAALHGVVDREQRAVPPGNGGVRLHRVVVLVRGGERGIGGDVRRGERTLHVAHRGVGREVRVHVVGGVEARMVDAQLDVVGVTLVRHDDGLGARQRGLQRGCDDDADDLTVVIDVG